MPIVTVPDLHRHLQFAVEVELATIPPYLYAMYSIADPASEAAEYVRSVVTEEMLHATLMANILLACGGEPRFYDPAVVPSYPGPWPHRVPELDLGLERCTLELIRSTFLPIERPEPPAADGDETDAEDAVDAFESQGQFYRAIESALCRLDDGALFADPQLDRQLVDPSGYTIVKYDDAASGGLVRVDGLDAALAAAAVPIHQGEGAHQGRFADDGGHELTHHAKFLAIAEGAVELGEVLPAVSNPSAATMGEVVRPVAELCDAVYSYLFVLLDRLLAPDRRDRHELVGLLNGTMVALLGPLARYLMTVPTGAGEVQGPPFAFHRFADAQAAEDELRRLGAPVARAHPELEHVLHHLQRLPAAG